MESYPPLKVVTLSLFTPGETIRDNISFGSGADDEMIEAAARDAQIHDAIMAAPKGYDTVLGGQGQVIYVCY